MTTCPFTDEFGAPVPAVDAAEMLEVDRIATEETGPNLYQMMENAGRNLALAALEMLGGRHRESGVTILAGTGGNGGGGITAGRHLMNHDTGDVVLHVTNAERLSEVAAQQLHIFRNADGVVVPDHMAPADVLGEGDLIIDAIIGYSLRGAPRGRALQMIEWANSVNVPVLSLDVPSGIDSTTGAAPGAATVATRTMTLAAPKHGLCAPQAGDLELADIGIPREVYRRVGRPELGISFNGRYRVPLRRNLGTDD
ncbi:NAD(P)H-hydrate epimerase [Actinomycetota bacterium]